MTKWMASFDIGMKNFAFYIEEFNEEELEKVVLCDKNKRVHIRAGITEEYQNSIKEVYLNGKTIYIKKFDLSGGCDSKKYLDPKIFLNLTEILDSHKDYFDQCSAFIIEQQMSFGSGRFAKINTRAIKIGQHVFSYFTILYKGFKPVIEFESYHKTQVFGMKKMKDKERKNWSVEQGKAILSERNEDAVLCDILAHNKKLDDLFDTICQLTAFKYLCYVEKKY